MTGLARDTLLRLAPEVRVELRGAEVHVSCADGHLVGPGELLDIVRAFRTPARFDAAVQALSAERAPHEWVRLNAAVIALYDAGVLRAGDHGPALHGATGFDSAAIHVRMLDDRARTEAFIAALRDAVRPDDVVVDLGTGTGILALAAAEAGARRVYAVEEGGIADAAAAVFARHERITLLRGTSTAIALPEKATLLVSEIIGDEPLGERVLEYFADARGRWLAEGARQLPVRLRVFAQGVKLDEATRRAHRFDAAQIAAWNSWYRLDLAPLAGAQPRDGYRFSVPPERAAGFLPRTEPVLLTEVDLSRPPVAFEHRAAAPVVESGGLDAVVSWFELDVDATRSLTSAPARAGGTCSWRCPVWLVPRGLAVRTGETVTMTYRHGLAGTRLWAT